MNVQENTKYQTRSTFKEQTFVQANNLIIPIIIIGISLASK